MPSVSSTKHDASKGPTTRRSIRRLLVVRGDLQSESEYAAAARQYSALLAPLFDRVLGVALSDSEARTAKSFPYHLMSETGARQLAGRADFALVLSVGIPDRFARYTNAANVGLTFWETDRFPLPENQRIPWAASANQMDALWVPSGYNKKTCQAAGVTTPIRVIPWPACFANFVAKSLGNVYDLDRRPPFSKSLLRLGRFRVTRNRALRRLGSATGPRIANALLGRLRASPRHLFAAHEQLLLAPAQDSPRHGLRLLLAEWMEFRRRVKDTPWVMVVRATSASSADSRPGLILRFWEQVQALKTQLRVRHAGVFFSAGAMQGPDFDRLLARVDGCVCAALGDGACQSVVRALAFGKPIIAPGHTGFAEYLPDEYPYRFATYPTTLRFVGDPQGPDYYDPSSTWHMPAPFALPDALVRFTQDPPECRAEAAERAGAIVKVRCDQQRVAARLAEEVQRLEAGQYQRVEEEEWGRDIVMRPPHALEPRRVRHESVAT